VENDKSVLILYNNANAVVLLAPLIVFFEGSYIVGNFSKLLSPLFWICLLVASVFGFSVALVTVLQIKVTSPLTHNISGTAKAAFQSILAFYIWGNQVTLFGIVGLFMVLFGSALYTMIAMRESNAPVSQPRSSNLEEAIEQGQEMPLLKVGK
jgi:GDP-fucose transporter C1